MSYPTHLLKGMLAERSTEGRVLSVSGHTVTLATPSGKQTALSASSTLRPGDRVTLHQGRAYKTAASSLRVAV